VLRYLASPTDILLPPSLGFSDVLVLVLAVEAGRRGGRLLPGPEGASDDDDDDETTGARAAM
jgi:hypothetical protein